MQVVYVCFFEYEYDGCGPPCAVFASEEAAKAWVAKQTPSGGDTAEYRALEVWTEAT